VRAHQPKFLSGWSGAGAPGLLPPAHPVALALHPLPLRGDATGLDQPSLPKRGKAGTRVLRCCAPEHESPVVCSANAPLTRRAQAGEALPLVEFGQKRTGAQPQWRDCDATVVPSPELAQLHHRGLWLVPLRRRGAALRRRLRARPARPWRQAVLDTPHRRQQRLRDLEETVPLPGHKGSRRQRAVTGLGREPPTVCVSNHAKESARALSVRSAGRPRVEDGLGMRVQVFHVDCVASAGRRNVALDPTMTVLAQGCYRWLAKQLRGFDTAAPQPLYRQCVETGGVVAIAAERIVVHCDQRGHHPLLREAALDQPRPALPWLQNLPVVFQYP
jgi:hypothetical protein